MTTKNTRIEQSGRRYSLVTLLTVLLVLNLGSVHSQKNSQHAFWIENSVQVNGTIEEAWQVLADFAGTGSFHVLYEETILLEGNPNKVVLGAERESLMPDGMFNLIQKERVVDVVDGAYFTYEVYDSDKSSTESMLVTYGVLMDEAGNVRIYNHITLEDGSSVWKNFSKRKKNRESQLSLMSYKHRIETGEGEKDIKILKKWYALNDKKGPDRELLATTDLKVN
jgi:hypothetical protein